MCTSLPLADEIREARAAHDQSAGARQLLQRVTTAIEAVDTIERQCERFPQNEGRVPGEDLISEIAEAWPILADLHAADPRPASPFSEQLQARRTQLVLAQQTLRPVARQLIERLERLHDLQQEQQRLLHDPRYAPILQDIQALNAERDGVIAVFNPLNQRLGVVEPTLKLLDNFIAKLADDEASGKSAPDPAGAVAWRTAYLAGNFLGSVRDVLSSVDFGVAVPEIPVVPPQPNAETAAHRWEEVEAALRSMRTLREDITAHAAEMTTRAQAASERYQELSSQILDLTG